MSAFIDKVRTHNIYDVHLLNKEISNLSKISEEGSTLIKMHILEQNVENSHLEFGIQDGYFFIQVILETFSVKKKKLDTDFVKFSYPIRNNKLIFETDLDTEIFNFYEFKVSEFLKNGGIKF